MAGRWRFVELWARKAVGCLKPTEMPWKLRQNVERHAGNGSKVFKFQREAKSLSGPFVYIFNLKVCETETFGSLR